MTYREKDIVTRVEELEAKNQTLQAKVSQIKTGRLIDAAKTSFKAISFGINAFLFLGGMSLVLFMGQSCQETQARTSQEETQEERVLLEQGQQQCESACENLGMHKMRALVRIGRDGRATTHSCSCVSEGRVRTLWNDWAGTGGNNGN